MQFTNGIDQIIGSINQIFVLIITQNTIKERHILMKLVM